MQFLGTGYDLYLPQDLKFRSLSCDLLMILYPDRISLLLDTKFVTTKHSQLFTREHPNHFGQLEATPIKYLGSHLDTPLKWTRHINKTLNKANTRLFKPSLKHEYTTLLWKKLIRPIILYFGLALVIQILTSCINFITNCSEFH